MIENQVYKYSAFISYRHLPKDRQWAEWLMDALETYRVPKELQKAGFPARLGRVFRDKDELPSDGKLNNQIEDALKASRFLLVICSTSTPESRWVSREIEIFKELGRADKIFPLLIAGEPNESFPPVLTTNQLISFDQAIIKPPLVDNEPIGADLRFVEGKSNKDIKKDELLRIIAGLLGCAFDDLKQRDKQREKQRAKKRKLITIASIFIVSIFVALAINSALEAKRERQKKAALEQTHIAESLNKIESHSRLIANLALKQTNPATAMLVALEAWNVNDPRSQKQFQHYLKLAVPERLVRLQKDWVEPDHADPSHSLASAVVREKTATSKEFFYRKYNSGDVVSSFSKDRSKFGMGYENGAFYIEDINSNKPVIHGQARDWIKEIFFTDDNQLAYVVSQKELITVHITSGKVVTTHKFENDNLSEIAFSPNKKYAVLASFQGQLSLLELTTGKIKSLLLKFRNAPEIIWPSKYLLIIDNKRLLYFDPIKNKSGFKFDLEHEVKKVYVDNFGKGIVVVMENNTVKVFDFDNKKYPTFNIPGVNYFSSHIEVDYQRNLMFVSTGRKIEIHSISGQKEALSVNCEKENIKEFTLSTDKLRLVAGTKKGRICIWDTRTQKRLWETNDVEREISAIEFNSDGDSLYFSTRAGDTHGWRWETPQKHKILEGCESDITTLLFSPDGRYLFARAGEMGLCRWDLHNGFKLAHMPSFTFLNPFPPFNFGSDKMVVTDREGFVIVGSLADLNNTEIYTASDAIFRAAGMVDQGKFIIGHTIDNSIYVWSEKFPSQSVKLSLTFPPPVSIWPLSNFEKYITLTDKDGNGYIFGGADGKLITKIDLSHNLINIVASDLESLIVFNLEDNRKYSIRYDELEEISSTITNEKKLIVYQATKDMLGIQLAITDFPEIHIVDLFSQHVLFSANGEDFGLSNLNYGAYKALDSHGIIAGVSNADKSKKTPSILVYSVPEIISRVHPKLAEQEILSSTTLSYEKQYLLSKFWRSESEDWVYRTATKIAVRCLTPQQRNKFNLKTDPPCWCAEKTFPKPSVWIETLGYNPFIDIRADGSTCTEDQRMPWISLISNKQEKGEE